jgi:hypothetical protein
VQCSQARLIVRRYMCRGPFRCSFSPVTPRAARSKRNNILIAEIISIPLTGFLTRMLTMRWFFVVAVSVFTLASVACAASGSFSTLIALRIVQGFSGGTLIPAAFSPIFLPFPFRLQPLATMIAGSSPFLRRPRDRLWEDGLPRPIPGRGFSRLLSVRSQ